MKVMVSVYDVQAQVFGTSLSVAIKFTPNYEI